MGLSPDLRTAGSHKLPHATEPHGFPCSSHDGNHAGKKRARGGEGRDELVFPYLALTMAAVGTGEVRPICVTLDLTWSQRFPMLER